MHLGPLLFFWLNILLPDGSLLPMLSQSSKGGVMLQSCFFVCSLVLLRTGCVAIVRLWCTRDDFMDRVESLKRIGSKWNRSLFALFSCSDKHQQNKQHHVAHTCFLWPRLSCKYNCSITKGETKDHFLQLHVVQQTINSKLPTTHHALITCVTDLICTSLPPTERSCCNHPYILFHTLYFRYMNAPFLDLPISEGNPRYCSFSDSLGIDRLTC